MRINILLQIGQDETTKVTKLLTEQQGDGFVLSKDKLKNNVSYTYKIMIFLCHSSKPSSRIYVRTYINFKSYSR